MEIPNATEMRSITLDARENERVTYYLDKIIRIVKTEAKKGKSEVILCDSDMKINKGDTSLDIACDKLIEQGFVVEPYIGSEVEHTCFGTGYVHVEGLIVSW